MWSLRGADVSTADIGVVISILVRLVDTVRLVGLDVGRARLGPLAYATPLLSPVVVAALVVAILVVLRHASKVRRLTGERDRLPGEGWA